MLRRIFIQNFALIDTLDIDLGKGLQVITGETGAGKSIILGALRLILGERADAKSIQNSDTKSIVEAEFEVSDKLKSFFDENDLDFEKHTIIRRELLPTGKSRAFINDVPATLEVVKNLSEHLIDIHSQFETSNLFSEEYQFKIIDGLSENKTEIVNYQSLFSEYKSLKRELADLQNRLLEGNKDSEYKNFLLSELLEANLDETNLDDLQSRLSLQENAESISQNLSEIFQRIDQEEVGLLDSLLDVRAKLSKVADLSHQFTEPNDRLEQIFVEFKDVLFELQNKAEKIEMDPQLLDELHQKVNAIQILFSKHQVDSVLGLIEIRDRLASEQSGFSDLEGNIAQIQQKIEKTEANLSKNAQKLAKNRKKSAKDFSEKMEILLKKLGLEKAKIEVELKESTTYNEFGKETIAILFQANSGFPLKPIQSAISGGERSRVMLAVKKIMAENSELPTLILDEIDTGVSGKVADEIGKLMQEMSQDLQLIVITHLAQVAAKGNQNYKVVKFDVDGKTKSDIRSLSDDEKLQEIAQLLSGAQITDAALIQAKELMK